MSVNQKRAYSTPSFSICFSACLRASGVDVARNSLSIMPIRWSLLSARNRCRLPIMQSCLFPGERQRGANVDDRVPVDVAERAVQLLHRLVPGLRPGVDLGETAVGRASQRVLLQRPGDPAAAQVAANRGQQVLGALRAILVVEQAGHPD